MNRLNGSTATQVGRSRRKAQLTLKTVLMMYDAGVSVSMCEAFTTASASSTDLWNDGIHRPNPFVCMVLCIAMVSHGHVHEHGYVLSIETMLSIEPSGAVSVETIAQGVRRCALSWSLLCHGH